MDLRRRYAVHEAGHAVAALTFGVREAHATRDYKAFMRDYGSAPGLIGN